MTTEDRSIQERLQLLEDEVRSLKSSKESSSKKEKKENIFRRILKIIE